MNMKNTISFIPIFFVAFIFQSYEFSKVTEKNSKAPITEIKIEEVFYKRGPHFKISSEYATWYLEKASGGFSSVIDRQGNDWIDWSDTGEDKFPSSAAFDYRGIPNMIHASEKDNGAGHPGFDVIRKVEILDENSIRFTSKSGKLLWSFHFSDNYVRMDIEEISDEQLYWILYEGPVGGDYNPSNAYWGTDQGMRSFIPDYLGEETVEEQWQWIYFGDKSQDRVFFAAQHYPDPLPDIMGFMGASLKGLKAEDGMVVFGFGRSKKAKPLMNSRNSYYFGFYEQNISDKKAYKAISEFINKLVE